MMPPVRSRFAIASSFALALAAGCGDDNNSSTTYSSGLKGEEKTAASKLTDDQREQFCSTLDTHTSVTVGLDEVTRIACLPIALVTATSRESCQELLDACSRDAPSVTVEQSGQRQRNCEQDLQQCDADVGTLETCVNVNIGAVRNILERFTCARFGEDNLSTELDRAMNTASACQKTSSSCQDAVLLI